ncbi:MAG: 16S rRNA (cytidine(1402)-2'-O)-methyltransferase [Pedosphaera sp.]|nr:16S rRNA (cytidine(1402)-2'-O)-methyltransferase [Pedosphaera sp.]
MPNPAPKGTLQIIATPIGNMDDITLRALAALKSCDVIAAEDTRHTRHLLVHHQINKPLLSCHGFNEASRVSHVLVRLNRGERVALVSDAGTPCISDPGSRIIRAVIDAGHKVEVLPGACALIAALAGSGLSCDEFHFVGFLPRKSGSRQNALRKLSGLSGTVITYESPYRVCGLLADIAALWPDAQVVVARELTKKFEEFWRGTASELAARSLKQKILGEFVVLFQPETACTKSTTSL